MDELAKKLIKDHKNPIVKVDLPGSKLLLKSSTLEEVEFIEKHQNNLENLLSHDRAERRSARSQAEWSAENELSKVTKVVKTLLQNFGYQDKKGIFLYPEETLFLMETNRLEVTCNQIPVSIQEGYDLLNRHKCSLLKYRVYKKLALLGYRLLRYEEILRRKLKNESKPVGVRDEVQKRSGDEGSEFEKETKKICLGTEVENVEVGAGEGGSKGNDIKEPQLKYIKNVFGKLRMTAPRECMPSLDKDEEPDYYVFLPSNKSRLDYDFSLFICEGQILERKHMSHLSPAIFAICLENNISFHRFSTVSLPFL